MEILYLRNKYLLVRRIYKSSKNVVFRMQEIVIFDAQLKERKSFWDILSFLKILSLISMACWPT